MTNGAAKGLNDSSSKQTTKEAKLKKIQLVTFKGCQSTIDFRTKLEEFIGQGKLEAEVELIIVPSMGKAKEMGLFGSPTILVDGIEYQQERHGPPGFY
jgi:hypothetical protein